jgi:hypothetical protein
VGWGGGRHLQSASWKATVMARAVWADRLLKGKPPPLLSVPPHRPSRAPPSLSCVPVHVSWPRKLAFNHPAATPPHRSTGNRSHRPSAHYPPRRGTRAHAGRAEAPRRVRASIPRVCARPLATLHTRAAAACVRPLAVWMDARIVCVCVSFRTRTRTQIRTQIRMGTRTRTRIRTRTRARSLPDGRAGGVPCVGAEARAEEVADSDGGADGDGQRKTHVAAGAGAERRAAGRRAGGGTSACACGSAGGKLR